MLQLKYGGGIVSFSSRVVAPVSTLACALPPRLNNLQQAFGDAATRCVASLPLRMLLRPSDQATLVVRSVKQELPNGILAAILAYLKEMGIPQKNISILVAPTPEVDHTEPKQHEIPAFLQSLNVQFHDFDQPDLIPLATTERGTTVRVNPLLAGRQRVIYCDYVRPDPVLGFTGGPECLLRVCGRETLEACLRLTLDAGISYPQTLTAGIDVASTLSGVFCDEMIQIARTINPLFSINLISDFHGWPYSIICGKWLEAWNQSCAESLRLSAAPLAEPADIVVASAGGFPQDADILSVAHGLLHAARAVKTGGTIVFAAECRMVDPVVFGDWVKSFLDGSYEDALRRSPSISGLYFYALMKLFQQYTVLMQTKINGPILASLGARAFRTAETLEAALDWNGKTICCIPDSSSVLPCLSPGV